MFLYVNVRASGGVNGVLSMRIMFLFSLLIV